MAGIPEYRHSGQNPCYEEPDRFSTFMIDTVLAANGPPHPGTAHRTQAGRLSRPGRLGTGKSA